MNRRIAFTTSATFTLLKGFPKPIRNLFGPLMSIRVNPITNFIHRDFNTEAGDVDSGYIKRYAISGTGKRSAVDMITNTGHNLSTDVPKRMGGDDSAPQPVEHLLAALLGCTQATAVFVGRTMTPRLLIDKIEFDLMAFRDERGALDLPIEQLPSISAMVQVISGTVKVHFKKGKKVTAEQLILLSEQTEARCPVVNMIHSSGCNIDLIWIDGSTTAS